MPVLRAKPSWVRYACGISLAVAVSEVAHELDPYWDVARRHPYLIEWPTIIAASWLCGLGPGLAAVAVSALAIVLYWIQPTHSLAVAHSGDLVALALFAACGTIVTGLIDGLHRARVREHELRRARELVLGVVAHDLRNPLTAIVATVSLLRRDPKDGESRLLVIERSARRMDGLIRDLVDASRLEADQALFVALGTQAIAPLMEEAAVAIGASASAKCIAISTEGATGLMVQCDRGRILQVLGNLLDNAVKFTPEGGRIALRAAKVGGFVRVEVTDSGPGIKRDHQSEVFKRHWVGGQDGAGAGLGLFIVHGIVRAHGGHIWLHSVPGHGTSFFFTIPAIEEDAPVERHPSRDFEQFRLS